LAARLRTRQERRLMTAELRREDGMLSRFRVLANQRNTLFLLITRDLKIKYADSKLGYLWSVLDPLLMAGVYWFVFTQLFNRGVGREPYILFLILGMLPWNWAQGVLTDATRALTADAKLVRSSNLDREVWVVRIVGAKAVEFVFSMPVIAIIAILTGSTPSWYLLAFPLAMAIQATFLLGAALALAPLGVLFTDVTRVMRILLRILFYLSPIIYGARDVKAKTPEWVGFIYDLNPLSGTFDLYRAAFFPRFFVGWTEVVIAAVVSLGFLALGFRIFTRLEGRALKEL
jgi:ABC-2 type transport system permease protein